MAFSSRARVSFANNDQESAQFLLGTLTKSQSIFLWLYDVSDLWVNCNRGHDVDLTGEYGLESKVICVVKET